MKLPPIEKPHLPMPGDWSGRLTPLRRCFALLVLALSVATATHVHGFSLGPGTIEVSKAPAAASTTGPCLACISRHTPTLSVGLLAPQAPALLETGPAAPATIVAPRAVVPSERPSRAPPCTV